MKLDFRILSLSLSVLAATPVLGQDSSEASVLEEVIVTARRAEENLQKVPLSITAIGAKDIEAAGITSPEDIAALTPGFSYRTNGRAGALPVMRGMSNILGAANVSFFIDGVVASGSIAGYNLDNVERIEVIRGPQSALFGRNTFAGAVNYVTRKPTDVFKGNVKLTVGEFNNQDFSGWASGPIVEGKLRFEVNGRYMNKDGQYTNLVSGKKDIGGVQTKSIGATMDWAPSDWFEATLRTNYSVDRDELPAQVAIGGPGTGLSGAQVLNCYLPLAGTRRRGYFCGTLPTLNFLSANTTSYEQAGVQAGRQANQFSSSLVLNAEWRDYNFTSTSSYDTNSSYGASDQDFSSLRGQGGAYETFNFNGSKTWSQELRVASPRDARLRWSAGVYQYEATPNDTSISGALVANPIAGLPGLPPNVNTQAVDSSTKNEAVFGMLEFDLRDNLTLTAEARYAEDTIHRGGSSNFSKSSNTGFVPGSYSAACTVVNSPIAGNPNRQTLTCKNVYVNDSSFKNFLPRVTATWLQNDSLTFYGQYSKGNKPGGFNAAVENARSHPDERARLVALGLKSYDEEEADSFEIGLKSRLFDQRVQFNTALYFIDWKNQQLTLNQPVNEEGIPVAGSPTQFSDSYIQNLGKSEIRGIEMEMLAALDDHWNLRMTYAYQDAKIKEYISPDQSDLIFGGPYTNCVLGSQCYTDYEAAGDLSGKTLPRVPKHLASASLSAKYPLSDRTNFHWRADYSYESSRYIQVHNLAETGNASVVNMRVGIDRDAWDMTFWVKNLFEDDTITDVRRNVDPAVFITVPVQPPLTGPATRTNPRDFAIGLADKRMFGATFSYRFN